MNRDYDYYELLYGRAWMNMLVGGGRLWQRHYAWKYGVYA